MILGEPFTAGSSPARCWCSPASGLLRQVRGESRHGSRNRRQVGAGLRREQGARQGLRAGAGRARASTSSSPRAAPRRCEATARRAARARPRRGARRRRRHHHRGRPRRGAGRLPAGRHPGQQRRRSAAGRLPRLGPRGLDQGDRRQHADADRADQGDRRRDGRARLRPHRQHHLGRGEGADRHPRPVERRAQRPDRLRRRPGAQHASPRAA